eukprot:TRINITY_DN2897_c0_g1_i1.p1 TRINITY_DN2897_c0_g1~~TRINITY_DN2897_c0_g1_i1.p1  ORF type:complete len:431 (-),score=54.63 TRINITY_DN2897_c0_g1_i1:714-2006(-)
MYRPNMQFPRSGGYGGDFSYDSYNGSSYHPQQPRRGYRNGGGAFPQVNKKRSNDESHQKARDREVSTSSSSNSSSYPVSVASFGSATTRKSGCLLDRFLDSTTPTAPLQYLPKTTMKLWKVPESESVAFFSLADLWESFDEWSAYGAGVPVTLNGGSDPAMQYYVPSLSALQLYCDPSVPDTSNRRLGEESDTSDCDFRDSSSEGSSSDEVERDQMYRMGHWRNSKAFDGDYSANLRIDRLSLRDRCKDAQEGSSSDEGETSNSLCFEYFERTAPYCREPLAVKVAQLAKSFPRLKTLRSIDLLPSSWLSVAWYPIYRIPIGSTLKDLAASFLTFHSLSTPLKDGSVQFSVGGKAVSGSCIIYSGGSYKIALPAFGLASYKFKGTVWSSGNSERLHADSLLETANEWLRLHGVQHPDYEFFLSHGSTYRR